MYADVNFKTKKALKDAVESGQKIGAFQPGGMFPGKTDGAVSIEGPHYPEPHKWYASCVLKDGIIISVR